MKRVLVLFGTRPEVIKLAPVIQALRKRSRDAEVLLCSTGQHRSMLDEAMAAFDLTADRDLAVMQPGQHPTDLFGRLLLSLRPLLEELAPGVVVVQGDTSTVAAGALAAFLHGARVAHVEAGLRTRDRRAPFPEEVNRRLAGVVADDHFAPTPRARENLLAEGVATESIFVTGNTIVDALHDMRRRVACSPAAPGRSEAGGAGPLDRLADGGGGPRARDSNRRLVLVTAHRRESFGEPFRELCLALRDIAERFDDVELLYPVHLNPQVQAPVREILAGIRGVRLAQPLGYGDFVTLLDRAELVITDSGGVQEEATALGKPTLVLRDKTERPEAVAAGIATLVGPHRERIVAEAVRRLSNPSPRDCSPASQAASRKPGLQTASAASRPTSIYGDGLAAQRIVEVILDGRMTTPPFEPAQ